jgi:NAD+ kinase
LIANPDKPLCRDLVRQAARSIAAAGDTVLAEPATAALAGIKAQIFPNIASLARASDLLMVFGGDGTMLRVAHEIAGATTPILGINAGALGFLTGVPAHQLRVALKQIRDREARLESRPLIEARARVGGRTSLLTALNDLVIARSAQARLIELEVSVDDEVLTRYRGDGLIVASPTGSTAYSLAAGGAIVSPSAKVFALTPICPHTLSNRSVIVSLDSTVRVRPINGRVETILTADGQQSIALGAGDVVTIRRSRHVVRLLHLTGNSFFETLRLKLNWSGSNV